MIAGVDGRGRKTPGYPIGRLLMDIQLHLYGFIDFAHIVMGENAGSSEKPLLAHGCQLICHGLAFFSFKDNYCLAGVEAIHVTG